MLHVSLLLIHTSIYSYCVLLTKQSKYVASSPSSTSLPHSYRPHACRYTKLIHTLPPCAPMCPPGPCPPGGARAAAGSNRRKLAPGCFSSGVAWVGSPNKQAVTKIHPLTPCSPPTHPYTHPTHYTYPLRWLYTLSDESFRWLSTGDFVGIK